MDIVTWLRNQWDRAGAWTAIFAGGVALLAGWLGASRSALTTEQIPYLISGGLGGLFLLGVGAMLWISADLRDEWRKLDQIADEISDRDPASDRYASDGGPTAVSATAVSSNGTMPRRRPLRAEP